MTTHPCCCTNAGAGHRCPEAWQLIILAQRAREQRNRALLDAARVDYTAHMYAAGLITYGTSAWPDTCTESITDDPRCAQCAPAGTA